MKRRKCIRGRCCTGLPVPSSVTISRTCSSPNNPNLCNLRLLILHPSKPSPVATIPDIPRYHVKDGNARVCRKVVPMGSPDQAGHRSARNLSISTVYHWPKPKDVVGLQSLCICYFAVAEFPANMCLTTHASPTSTFGSTR